MLNEINEIDSLLNGKRINKKYTYRSCYLLAKYYKSLGCEHKEIRSRIIAWAKEHDIYITDDLNSIIQKAIKDKKKLIDNIEIRISENDIKEIIKRFDKYNTRLTAFAVLCISKKYATKDGIFYMSRIGLSNWIGIAETHLSNRYIKELIDFDYIEKINNGNFNYIKKRNKFISKIITYKIKVSFNNMGKYIVRDNNIREEFENIIANYGIKKLLDN